MSQRKISARDFIQDIRAGLTDSQLMGKYKLTALGLQSAFTKLVDAGALKPEELFGRLSDYDSTIGVEGLRLLQRHSLDFPLPVIDTERTGITGAVRDISHNGLGIIGIDAVEGESRAFMIPADQFFQIEPIVFRAQCRWIKYDEDLMQPIGGFQIIRVSKGNLRELRRLIQSLTLHA
ncbi:MAG: PilZ domain-containing protein [Desulfomonile sp.]|nr:PilZ domain-containing protein [Desulfomonile sp.]